MSENQSEGAVPIRILRGSVGSLSLYEITDYELDIFEQGSPSSTLLNFAIFFSSIGLSFLMALLTVDIASIYVFTAFSIVSFLGISLSMVLFVLWRRMRSPTKDLCKKIRQRVPVSPVESHNNHDVGSAQSRANAVSEDAAMVGQ